LQRQYALEIARTVFESGAGVSGQAWKDVEAPLLAAIEQSNFAGLRAPLYVVVEKILGKGEQLPDDWPTYGASGYEFLNLLNGLFVDSSNVTLINRVYNRWTDLDPLVGDLVYQK